MFFLLTLLIVGLSAQERRRDSPRRPGARTSRPDVDNSRLVGAYRLNTARSDNARAAVYEATNSLPEIDQLLILGGLMSRLESPDLLVIEQRGYAVTIASSSAPRVTFDADGREHSVRVAGGRTARARATLSGGRLLVSTKGDRGSDFGVTFGSRDGGRGLEVTRRIYADQYNQPIAVRSFYDGTPDAAGYDR
ncbi:MAG: hypothetical protein M3416_03510 [Acidobacteriota bacterium]|nr:hypothetical protein [Acidobacteriota bacterium]